MPAPLRVPLVVAVVLGVVSFVVVLILTAYARRHTGFGTLDWDLLRDVRRHRSPAAVDASNLLADLGSIGTLLVAGAAIGLLLRWRGLHPLLCAVPLASLLVTGGFVQVIKVAVDRTGPHAYSDFANRAPGSFPTSTRCRPTYGPGPRSCG